MGLGSEAPRFNSFPVWSFALVFLYAQENYNRTQEIMMLKFTKTSRKKELEGATAEYDDGCGNVLHLTIARSSNNPHYESKLTTLMQPYQAKLKKGKEISNDIAKRLLVRAYAEEILLDWDEKDLLDEDGKPVKYSVDNAIELLTNDGDLREFVEEFSANINNYIDVEEVSGK